VANPARLHDLQKMDSTWEKIRRRLLLIQKLSAVPEALVAQRDAFAQTENELHDWRARQRNAEMESQSLRERIYTTEQRLAGGTVRNPREIEQLQASVDALRRQQSGVEEAGIEALLQVEQLSATRDSQRKALDGADAEWSKKLAELIAEEGKLKRHGVQLKGQRAALVAQLPAGDLALYEDLRKRKAGVAVTEVTNGLCAACSVRLPTGIVSAAKTGNELIYCPSCGRILVA
jgi:predicted  nucleic acid-binding Zn-ribbon protein